MIQMKTLLESYKMAKTSKVKGNLPYGCILVNKEGKLC